jgi:hypothetical protein
VVALLPTVNPTGAAILPALPRAADDWGMSQTLFPAATPPGLFTDAVRTVLRRRVGLGDVEYIAYPALKLVALKTLYCDRFATETPTTTEPKGKRKKLGSAFPADTGLYEGTLYSHPLKDVVLLKLFGVYAYACTSLKPFMQFALNKLVVIEFALMLSAETDCEFNFWDDWDLTFWSTTIVKLGLLIYSNTKIKNKIKKNKIFLFLKKM